MDISGIQERHDADVLSRLGGCQMKDPGIFQENVLGNGRHPAGSPQIDIVLSGADNAAGQRGSACVADPGKHRRSRQIAAVVVRQDGTGRLMGHQQRREQLPLHAGLLKQLRRPAFLQISMAPAVEQAVTSPQHAPVSRAMAAQSLSPRPEMLTTMI